MFPAVDLAAADPTEPVDPPVDTSKEWLEPTGEGLVRPDWVSAGVTARSTGRRVEVLSARSGQKRSWVLPSGEVDAEVAGGPVRFKDVKATATDGWRDIDTNLAFSSDGSVGPKAVPGEVRLSKGGLVGDLVSMVRPSGRKVALDLGLAGLKLPEPTLDGPVATYPDVLPGVDVTVEVRPGGFEQLWVVKDRAGLLALLAAGTAGSVVALPGSLTVGEVAARATSGGAVELLDAKDKVVGSFGTPTMWDGEVNPGTGEPVNRRAVEFRLSDGARPLEPGDAGKSGELGLAVRADRAWLASPERTFPISIDPTYAEADDAPFSDAFVQEGVTSDMRSDPELKIGDNGTGDVARTFFNFDRAPFAGKTIMSASLNLWAVHSWNCTAKSWSSYHAGTIDANTRWTNQPSIGTLQRTSTQTKGYDSSCPDGTVSIDMKQPLQTFADEPGTLRGMALKAGSETDETYWKRFASLNSSHPPVLRWTYNRVPTKPEKPQVPTSVLYRPAGSSVDVAYVADRTPKLSGLVGDDADGDTVRAEFAAFPNSTATTGALSSCVTGYVAAGTSSSCDVTTTLADNTAVWVKGRSYDHREYSGWTTGREVRVAATKPANPVVTCTGYSNNSWVTTVPGSPVSCKISGTGSGFSAPSRLEWSIDNQPWTGNYINQSTDPAQAFRSVTIPNSVGGHSIRARAVSPSKVVSNVATFSVGWGTASLTAPTATPRVTTTDAVDVLAAGPPKGASANPTAKVQWRVAGATGTNGWKDAPAGSAPLTVSETGGQTKAAGVFDTAQLDGQGDASTPALVVNGRVPTLVDVRVCLSYDSGTQCTTGSTVLKVPHAFGNGYPTDEAGPGEVALWTGELQVSDTDAALDTPVGGLSVSRTHSSFAGPAATQNAVFGPGWTASFDSDDSGAGGAELVDGTPFDGTLAVLDAEGGVLVFGTPSGARRTTATIPAGTYKPADEETRLAGVKLVVSGSGASTVAELTGEDAVVTKFQVTAAPTTAAATFRTVEVRETAVVGKTSYSYDASGRVTALVAPLPDGVTACVPGTATAGCRALKITYATTTTATSGTPGDYAGRVKKITAQVNTDADRELASYKYDSTGRLVEAVDSRTGLTTGYTWTGTGTGLRLATLTPPGLTAFTFGYDTAADKLAKVTRPNPASAGGGTAQLAAYVYDLPTSGTGLPDLPAVATALGQGRTPTWGAAVFGPDQPISGITPAAVTNIEWWKKADLSFTDGEGYTVNTVGWGAGDWQYSAADYDQQGNVTAEWDQRGVRYILDAAVPSAAARDYATVTRYNADILDGGGQLVTPAGSLVTDTWTPVQDVVPTGGDPADGTLPLRNHTVTTYDQGAPNLGINPDTGMPYRLPTKTVTTAETASETISSTLDIGLTGYEKIETSDAKTGWQLGQATTTTQDMDLSGTVTTGDITSRTRYDDRGRAVETRQPESSGTDAGTRRTVFYTAGTSSVTGCGGNAALAGEVCQVGPVAQPPGQTMPVTKMTGYTWDGQASSETHTSGTVTSTTTTTFTAQDRPQTVTTSVTGLSGSQAVPAVTTSYDSATGLVTGTTSSAGSTAMTYDAWGRQLTYTNTPAGQPADTATTTYNALGQVTSVVDGNGSTTYTYDGTDANGQPENRGLVTTIAVKITGGTDYTSTGAYDHAGVLVTEKLPGKIIRRTTIDHTGQETGIAINGKVLDEDTSTFVEDQPWLGWATQTNPEGETVREYTPAAAANQGDAGETAIASDRTYSYDRAGRLITVQDRTGNPDTGTGVVDCLTRSYAFDANGNRTAQASYPAGANGDCATIAGTTTTRAYDTADRPTTGGNGTGSYTYDQLGRQTVIPSADAPHSDRGNITLGYYDTDAVHTITQNAATTTFTLDGAGRRLAQTTSGTGGNTLVRHYTDESDDPAWSVDTTGGTTTTTRYAELLDGDLGLTLTTNSGTTTAELALGTARGDTATTIDLPAGATGPDGTAALGIDDWTEYTEYGTPRQTVATTSGGVTGIGYGWLGTKQRATPKTGLTLMGARLYNRTTGLFTSTDPVRGGGATTYGYPNNPIRMRDLDGRVWNFVARAAIIGCRIYCKRAGRFVYKRWLRPAARWSWRQAKRSYYSVRRAYRSVRAGTNPYLRIGEGRVSFGNARRHWLKTSGWRRQVTRLHGHFGRRRSGGHWYGVDFNTRRRTYWVGFGWRGRR